MPVTISATPPLKSRPWRWIRTWPATTALKPSSAARLRTFEPITTPTPSFP
jgi:hypothetical protein